MSDNSLKRPENEEEFRKREAIGTIRASRFVRGYAKTNKPINAGIIYEIHKEIFRKAWPEIAGKLRQGNLRITDSHHIPPDYKQVPEKMKLMGDELTWRLNNLRSIKGVAMIPDNITKEGQQTIDDIIEMTAWIHHKITHIHPFWEGNGRTARLVADLILERHGLMGISIKIEKENKKRYTNALKQIDDYNDYEPLKDLIAEGLIDRYHGISFKLLKSWK